MSHRDAAQVRGLVPIADAFRAWNATVKNGRASCPLCAGSATFTVALNAVRGLFHCHRCKASGDVFSLAQRVCGCDFHPLSIASPPSPVFMLSRRAPRVWNSTPASSNAAARTSAASGANPGR